MRQRVQLHLEAKPQPASFQFHKRYRRRVKQAAQSTNQFEITMNPVYSPTPTGVPFTNTKGIGYPAGFPVGYAAPPTYTPGVYPGANPAFPSGYSPGTPFKMTCSPNTGAVPPYTSTPNPYQAAMYPVRSTYPQQNPYAQALIPSQQQGTYYTQPLYHGDGSRHNYGHVSRNIVDYSFTSACCTPPNANLPASWDPQLQLCAPTVVKG
uniref:Uncharacterized protein n=1 Tax=Knipowitschia caucasica TaxID=637954 RepID=A0AAV2L2Q9_KNICA